MHIRTALGSVSVRGLQLFAIKSSVDDSIISLDVRRRPYDYPAYGRFIATTMNHSMEQSERELILASSRTDGPEFTYALCEEFCDLRAENILIPR